MRPNSSVTLLGQALRGVAPGDRESNQKRTEAKAIKADDEAAFPGGLVPKAMPARRMQGKVRTRRR